MAISVNFNGATYSIPSPGDTGWGTDLDTFFQAIAAYALSKGGGSQPLTGQLNLGASFGVTGPNFTSATSTPATTGVVRLAGADKVKWRDPVNSVDVELGTDTTTAFNSLVYRDRFNIQLLLSNFPQSRSKSSAGQILGASATTTVAFATSDFNPYGVTPGTMTVPAPAVLGGVYQVSAMITPTAAMAATAGSTLSVFKNGSELVRLWAWRTATANNGPIGGQTLVSVVPGDVLDIRFVNATASPVTLTSSALENYVTYTRIPG